MYEQQHFSLNPVHFFALAADCKNLTKAEKTPSLATHLLPSTHHLTREESFAKIAMGWHEEGLSFLVQATGRSFRSSYPDLEKGDSVELWIDTRDVKSAGFNTRFCHHFFFLIQEVEGITKGEITHFRTEDSHPLCDANLLQSTAAIKKDGYKLKIFIPSQCLYGYDPKQFDRLGFTYRINRTAGAPQHFAVVSKDYQIDQQPSLWGSLKLV